MANKQLKDLRNKIKDALSDSDFKDDDDIIAALQGATTGIYKLYMHVKLVAKLLEKEMINDPNCPYKKQGNMFPGEIALFLTKMTIDKDLLAKNSSAPSTGYRLLSQGELNNRRNGRIVVKYGLKTRWNKLITCLTGKKVLPPKKKQKLPNTNNTKASTSKVPEISMISHDTSMKYIRTFRNILEWYIKSGLLKNRDEYYTPSKDKKSKLTRVEVEITELMKSSPEYVFHNSYNYMKAFQNIEEYFQNFFNEDDEPFLDESINFTLNSSLHGLTKLSKVNIQWAMTTRYFGGILMGILMSNNSYSDTICDLFIGNVKSTNNDEPDLPEGLKTSSKEVLERFLIMGSNGDIPIMWDSDYALTHLAQTAVVEGQYQFQRIYLDYRVTVGTRQLAMDNKIHRFFQMIAVLFRNDLLKKDTFELWLPCSAPIIFELISSWSSYKPWMKVSFSRTLEDNLCYCQTPNNNNNSNNNNNGVYDVTSFDQTQQMKLGQILDHYTNIGEDEAALLRTWRRTGQLEKIHWIKVQLVQVGESPTEFPLEVGAPEPLEDTTHKDDFKEIGQHKVLSIYCDRYQSSNHFASVQLKNGYAAGHVNILFPNSTNLLFKKVETVGQQSKLITPGKKPDTESDTDSTGTSLQEEPDGAIRTLDYE